MQILRLLGIKIRSIITSNTSVPNIAGGYSNGEFKDEQEFDHLASKIKAHWHGSVNEVIVGSCGCYLIVCCEGIDFAQFGRVFYSAIGEISGNERPISFKVYNAVFSEDFEVSVS